MTNSLECNEVVVAIVWYNYNHLFILVAVELLLKEFFKETTATVPISPARQYNVNIT